LFSTDAVKPPQDTDTNLKLTPLTIHPGTHKAVENRTLLAEENCSEVYRTALQQSNDEYFANYEQTQCAKRNGGFNPKNKDFGDPLAVLREYLNWGKHPAAHHHRGPTYEERLNNLCESDIKKSNAHIKKYSPAAHTCIDLDL